MLKQAVFLFCLACMPVYGKQLNVYVTYQDSALHENIKQFNQFLASHGIFKKYQLKPFLDDFPLHTTLYLSEYEQDNIPQVINTVALLARTAPAINIKTTQLVISAGSYVMMDVRLDKSAEGQNHPLQTFSDQTVLKLVKYRDVGAKIPDWAKNIPVKREAFARYGSPNVFFEFSAHFTLMAKSFMNPATAKAFHDEMAALIKQYQQLIPVKITLTAKAIAVGAVNEYGQVSEELASFPIS